MTLTSRSIEWLDQNSHRAYPMELEEWRAKVPADSGLDCVVLDASVFDCDASGGEVFSLERVDVSSSKTSVVMKYGDVEFEVSLDGGEEYELVRGAIESSRGSASFSLAFSGHERILSAAGEGHWDLGCRFLRSRVATISGGIRVDGIKTNGSAGVDGRSSASVAEGDVVLEDGYRTSPVVFNGSVLVRVGRQFGINPCKYDFGEDGSSDCRRPLFFFCGQNAINGGNVSLSGGVGISVTQGRSYTVRSGTCSGKTIPCIEISAGRQILDMYRPG